MKTPEEILDEVLDKHGIIKALGIAKRAYIEAMEEYATSQIEDLTKENGELRKLLHDHNGMCQRKLSEQLESVNGTISDLIKEVERLRNLFIYWEKQAVIEHGKLLEKENQNDRYREALEESKTVLQWHLDKSVPYRAIDHSDFFNMTANAIDHVESALHPLVKEGETKKIKFI